MTGLEILGMISGVSASFLAGLLWIARSLDTKLRPISRQRLVHWLSGVSAADDMVWYDVFTDGLDGYFGRRSISVKGYSVSLFGFKRTAIMSVFCVVALSILYLSTQDHGIDVGDFFEGREPLSLVLLSFVFLINIPTDYLSMNQTRWFLTLLKPRHNNSAIKWLACSALLLLDLVFSLAIFVVVYILAAGTMYLAPKLLDGEFVFSLASTVVWFNDMIFIIALLPNTASSFFEGDGQLGVLGAAILSTMLATVWLWMYLVGAFFVRLIGSYAEIFRWANKHFEVRSLVERYPISLIVYSAISVVSIFNLSAYFVLLLL